MSYRFLVSTRRNQPSFVYTVVKVDEWTETRFLVGTVSTLSLYAKSPLTGTMDWASYLTQKGPEGTYLGGF